MKIRFVSEPYCSDSAKAVMVLTTSHGNEIRWEAQGVYGAGTTGMLLKVLSADVAKCHVQVEVE